MSGQVQLDDLQYDWPTNVTGYEAKLFLGIGMYEAVTAAMVGLGASILLSRVIGTGTGYLAGMILGGLALIMLRKHEALGNRRLPGYVLALFRHRLGSREMHLAWIMPSAPLDIEIVDSQTADQIYLDKESGL